MTRLDDKLAAKEAIQANAQKHLQKLTEDLEKVNSLISSPITKQLIEVRNQLSLLADEIYSLKGQIERQNEPVRAIRDVRGGEDF